MGGDFMKGKWSNQTLLASVALMLLSIMSAAAAAATQAADGPSSVPARLVTYGPYTLPGEFPDLKLIIKTDLGIIAPNLQGYPRDDPQLLAAIQLGSNAAQIVEQTGWGHIVPYVYAATYHFLGRLFYGLSTSTPLLPKTRKNNVTFTLLLISDNQLFRQHASAAGHGIGVGYWDARRREAGISMNKALFRWVGYQTGWKGRHPAIDVQMLSRYITRVTIREIGHEVFHAIQTFTDSRFYHFPLMVEATALWAQHNSFDREEMVVLVSHQGEISTSSTGDRGSADACLSNMFSEPWPGDLFSMRKLRQAYEATKRTKDFSLVRLLLLDETGFYGVSSKLLADRYSIALSVIYFLRSLGAENKRDWEAVLQEAYKRDAIKSSRKAASRLDAAYLRYMEQLATRWWKADDVMKKYQQALDHQTQCLNGGVLVGARQWAISAGAYMPDSPTPALYLGDVFFRVNEPFTALDYYKLAESSGDPSVFGEYPTRIKSRIGDALEQLGDIQGALSQYEAVLSKKIESPWLIFMIARTQLKYDYYYLTEASGRWRTEEHREVLNRYVKSLQTGEAAKVAQEQRARGDANGCVTTVVAQYKLLFEQMQREMNANRRLQQPGNAE
jgi:tetratricopeptide (TPR) repeat protein